jgi:nitrate reductase gamma subunit
MDTVVLIVIATQIVTGIWIAVGYRWGSYWGTSVFVPYMHSLFQFQPEVAYVAPLPLVLKLHALSFFAFLAVFPFTRLVHIITLPLQYLFRPWQKVVANRRQPSVDHVTNDPRIKAGQR